MCTALFSLSSAIHPRLARADRRHSLHISAPTTAIGDGRQLLSIRVSLRSPAAAAAPTPEFTLVAEAGTVADSHEIGTAGVEFAYTTPLIATARTVELVARATVGRRRLRARHTLHLTPAPDFPELASTGGPFDLRAPARMLLGRDDQAEITLRQPADTPPRLLSSAGTLSPLSETGDGRLRATFTPPHLQHPLAAIIVAMADDGSQFDWLAIRLDGMARAHLRSEPRARVRVRAGGREYGPVQTDRRGKATLMLRAAPGEQYATTIAADELGNLKRGRLSLDPPPFRQHVVVCPIDDSRMWLFAVDETGAPALQVPVRLSASRGALSQLENLGPGVYTAHYSAPGNASLGDAVKITATWDDRGPSASCVTNIPGEIPTALSIELDPAFHVAGSRDPIDARVELRYPGRLPALKVPVELAVDFGTLSRQRGRSKDALVATWSLPRRFDGRRSATLTARVAAKEPLWQTAVLELRAAAAASLELTAEAQKLRADGRQQTTLAVRAKDPWGNPSTQLHLAARARGHVGPFTVDESGTLRATYRVPRAYRRGRDIVVVQAYDRDLSGRVAIELTPAPRPLSVIARVGYLTNFAKISAPLALAEINYRPALADQRLVLGAQLGGFRSSYQGRATNEKQTVSSSLLAALLLGRAAAEVSLGPVQLYAGGATGLVRAQSDVSTSNSGRIVVSRTHPAWSLLAGVAVPLGPGRAVLETGYLWAPIDHGTVRGNIGGVQSHAGYRHDF